MNLIRSQANIFEKVLRDREGRLVRARFSVYEFDGKIKAKLLDWEYIDIKAIAGKILALPGFVSRKKNEYVPRREGAVPSPFFVQELLHVSGSKPRAPTI